MGQPETSLVKRLAAILMRSAAVDATTLTEQEIVRRRFTLLGLNSIDYLEFVLNVEQELNIDIPDEALQDPKLFSLETWASWLEQHAEELRTPLAGPAAGRTV